MDVVTAFLNPDVEEEIYIHFPRGRRSGGIQATLHRLHFTRCNYDPCLYARKEKSEFIIIALYVDDPILASNSSDFFPKSKLLSKTIAK